MNPCRICRKSDTLIALRNSKNAFRLLYLRSPHREATFPDGRLPRFTRSEFVSRGVRCFTAIIADKIRRGISPVLRSVNLCYTFRNGGASPSGKYPSVILPYFLPVGRGKGRTRHDVGIHMTRRCALHGLHPYRYVRHSVRPERVPPPPVPPTPLIR